MRSRRPAQKVLRHDNGTIARQRALYIAGATTNFIQALDDLLAVVKESEDNAAKEQVETELEIDALRLHGTAIPPAIPTVEDGDEYITPYNIFAEETAVESEVEEAAVEAAVEAVDESAGDAIMNDPEEAESAAGSEYQRVIRG